MLVDVEYTNRKNNRLKRKDTKPVLLIIDEWRLLKLTEAEARNLFELYTKDVRKPQRSSVPNFVKMREVYGLDPVWAK